MLEPGRFPGGGGDEVRFFSQAFGDPFGGSLGGFGILAAHGDDQFTGIGEILLEEFQAFDDGLTGRKQIEYFDIEAEPIDSQCHRDDRDDQEPAIFPLHSSFRNRMIRSPVRLFSMRVPPSAVFASSNGGGGVMDCNPRSRWSQSNWNLQK